MTKDSDYHTTVHDDGRDFGITEKFHTIKNGLVWLSIHRALVLLVELCECDMIVYF